MVHPFVRSAGDALAAGSLSAAVWFSLTSVFNLMPLIATCAAALVFIRIFASLQRLPAQVGPSASFVPAPLDFDVDELVLTHPVDTNSRVVRLFGPMPTPGEMHQRIDEHLRDGQRPPADASDELRDALAQLRRAVS